MLTHQQQIAGLDVVEAWLDDLATRSDLIRHNRRLLSALISNGRLVEAIVTAVELAQGSETT